MTPIFRGKIPALIAVVVGLASAVSAQNLKHPGNVDNLIADIKSATTEVEVQRVKNALRDMPIESRAELYSLYEAARSQEDAIPHDAKVQILELHHRKGSGLAVGLKNCTQPALHEGVADLIHKEFVDAKKDSRSPMPKITKRARMKSIIRHERIGALIAAAGRGKNEKARAALWEIIELTKDDHLGKAAADSIGEIGNREDLDRLVGMIKKDPKLLYPLGKFGGAVIPRVLRELTDPTMPVAVKSRLSLAIIQASSHDTINELLPLLNNKEPVVVKAAADALRKNVQPDDEAAIRTMLNHSTWNIRASAITAVGHQAWRPEYGPLLIEILKSDPSEWNRSSAAQFLGERRVQAALPALEAALQDGSGLVRDAAASAIKKIST